MSYTYEEAYEASLDWFGGDELAAGVFVGKYALRDSDGNLLEKTPDQMHDRLAREFARIESRYGDGFEGAVGSALKLELEDIRSLLSEWDEHLGRRVFGKTVPQGSPMAGVGNDHKLLSLSNCFVIEAPHDSYAGILHTDQEQAQIMKRRGGVGFDLSNIRPGGVVVANAAGTSDGIEIFMDRYSNTTREVAQNGRRGALMLTISVHHPEVDKFINIKQQLDRVTGANISVRTSDDFMRAVKAGETYTQYWPCTPGLPPEEYEICREVDAREIWSQMMQAAWKSAEPGVLFWDTIKERSPADIYAEEGYSTQSTNPCLVGSTRVETSAGTRTIQELAESGDYFRVLTYNEETGESEWDVAEAKMTKPQAKLLKIRATNGKEVLLTPDHKVLTSDGWIEASQLKPGQKIRGVS